MSVINKSIPELQHEILNDIDVLNNKEHIVKACGVYSAIINELNRMNLGEFIINLSYNNNGLVNLFNFTLSNISSNAEYVDNIKDYLKDLSGLSPDLFDIGFKESNAITFSNEDISVLKNSLLSKVLINSVINDDKYVDVLKFYTDRLPYSNYLDKISELSESKNLLLSKLHALSVIDLLNNFSFIQKDLPADSFLEISVIDNKFRIELTSDKYKSLDILDLIYPNLECKHFNHIFSSERLFENSTITVRARNTEDIISLLVDSSLIDYTTMIMSSSSENNSISIKPKF